METRPRGIFVSYRREDAAGEAGRLADHLVSRFGRRAVFLDVQQIVPGDDWRQRLDSALEACDTLLVVMGRNWSGARTEATKGRRIHHPDDMVAWEVAQALRRGMRVIQVCVQGVTPLTAETLPPAIAGLAMRQAYWLRHESFASDVRLLGNQIVASRRARATLGRDWLSSDLSRWARLSAWATCSPREGSFSDAAVATVHAMELLLRRAALEVALSAGYLDARSRAFENASLEHGELALSTCIYVASLIGVPVARRWPRKLGPRRRPQGASWPVFEFDSYSDSGNWCRAHFFRVDGLADLTRQLAVGRPVVCLCWLDFREGEADSPIDDGVLQRAPPVERRNARAMVLVVGYEAMRRRFRCMWSAMTSGSQQPMFEVPVEVARAAFELELMWAVEVGADSIDRMRSWKRKARKASGRR
jgi:TIR domain-containing protein